MKSDMNNYPCMSFNKVKNNFKFISKKHDLRVRINELENGQKEVSEYCRKCMLGRYYVK